MNPELIVLSYAHDYEYKVLIGVYDCQEKVDLMKEHLIHTEDYSEGNFGENECILNESRDDEPSL